MVEFGVSRQRRNAVRGFFTSLAVLGLAHAAPLAAAPTKTTVETSAAGSGLAGTGNLLKIGSTVYFAATDDTNGTELWKYDGTAAPSIVEDINVGAGSSNPANFIEFNGTLYFTAASNGTDIELWRLNGGDAELAANINGTGASTPLALTVAALAGSVSNKLYFTATNGTNGRELFVFDGSSATMVSNIDSASTDSIADTVSSLVVVDLDATVAVNNKLFFPAKDSAANGTELWVSDGTTSTLVKNINDRTSGTRDSSPTSLVAVGNTLYFAALDNPQDTVNDNHGIELWKSDGTTGGTVLVKDIRSGASDSSPANLTNLNGVLVFTATDGTNGVELWKSTDGTSANTTQVANINSGTSNTAGTGPLNLTVFGTDLYFSADNGGTAARELWKYDGTNAPTQIENIATGNNASSSPASMRVVDNVLWFAASDGTNGTELFSLSGSDAVIQSVDGNGVAAVDGLVSGATASNPSGMVSLGTVGQPGYQLIMAADTATQGRELVVLTFNLTQTYSIAAATAVDENSGNQLSFAVTRSSSVGALSAGYTTVDGTATVADGDYTAASGTLEFANGETTKNILVTVNGDTNFETNEALSVMLTGAPCSSDPTKCVATIVVGSGTASGTITNDDVGPEFSIADVSVAEGAAATTTPMTFTVTRTNPGSAASVDFTITGVTATAGGDYTVTSATGTVNFAADMVTTQDITNITVNGDNVFEGAETLTVGLSNPVGGLISTAGNAGLATGTITNDDAPATLRIDTNINEPEDTGNFTFTVTREGNMNGVVSAQVDTANGTATAGSDYTAFVPGAVTVSFPDDGGVTTTQTVTVTVAADTTVESDETFTVTLSNPVGANITDATGTGTIQNDDEHPAVSVSDVSLAEGNSGTQLFTFAVTRACPGTPGFSCTLNSAATVRWTATGVTAQGTNPAATKDFDQVTGNNTLNFASGNGGTTETVAVTVYGDGAFEADDTFNVTLSDASANLTVADGTGVGTILNDDTVPDFSIGDVSQAEGSPPGTTTFNFTVTRTGNTTGPITVNYGTVDWTATDGVDFTGVTAGTLTMPGNGLTSETGTISITIAPDLDIEADETFDVVLSSTTPAGGTFSDGAATGTIENDDFPTISITNVELVEGDSSTTDFVFTVTRSPAGEGDIVLDYVVADVTTTSGDDYVAIAPGTVSFTDGGLDTQTITVQVNGDTVDTGTETFTVTLAQATGSDEVTLLDNGNGVGVGLGTITDDDSVPTVEFDATTSSKDENDGTPAHTITVNRTGDTTVTSQVLFGVTGTATGGTDYTISSGTLSFGVGETSKLITVTMADDSIFEGNETVILTLNTPTQNGTVLGTQTVHTLTITENETVPTVQFGAATGSADENDSPFTIAVNRTGATGAVSTVPFSVTGGTATVTTDFGVSASPLTFGVGVSTVNITITPVNDNVFEPNETVVLTLGTPSDSNGTVLGAQTGHTSTINNDDTAPVVNFSAAAQSVSETAGLVTVTISLSNPSSSSVSAPYTISGGTASGGGGDFTLPTASPIVIAAGQTSGSITFNTVNDTATEVAETVVFSLQAPTGGTLGVTNPTHTVTITDDDTARTAQFSAATQDVEEGDTVTVTVTLSSSSTTTITVPFTVTGDTATAVDDYGSPTPATEVTFAAGQTSQDITFMIVDDTDAEGAETLDLALGAPVGGATLGTVDDQVVTIAASDQPSGGGGGGGAMGARDLLILMLLAFAALMTRSRVLVRE